MAEEKRQFKVLQNYYELRKGKKVEYRDIRDLLLDNQGLWTNYAKMCGEPTSCRNYGFGFIDRPNESKVAKRLLEDLLNMEIIEEITR